MNCPRCGTELACGWWCVKCNMTLREAKWLAFMERPDKSIPWKFVAVCVIAIVISIVCLGVNSR